MKNLRVLNLIIQDRQTRDWNVWVENFWIDPDVEDPKQALYSAVKEFITSGTKEAKRARNYACGAFNWGDAMSSVPDAVFCKHGLRRMTQHETVDVDVEHDEILC